MYLGLTCWLLIAGFGINAARAAWEEPSAEAPGGNVFGPLNIGPDMQTKQGRLLLDPLYNPLNSMPPINNQLEVRGEGAYFSTLYASQTLAVDTDTLVVNDTGLGIGTANPTVALQVADSRVRVTTDLAGVAAVQSRSSGSSGLYAYAEGADLAAVYGTSASGFGVYGINEFGGTGVFGRSETSSAVVGSTAASYNPTNIIAGVYGQASGLNSWAGYFQQRLFGSDQIIGRKFSPNRLQNSQISYTAGWEMRQVEDSRYTSPKHIVFDGNYLWVSQAGEFDNMFIIDPVSGTIAQEFYPADNYHNHIVPNKMIFVNGYIWAATKVNTGTCIRGSIARINVDPDNIEIINYPVTDCPPSGYSTAIDLVYDNQTTGGPYIWTVNWINRYGGNYDYSLGRLNLNDYSYMPPIKPSGQCLTFDPSRCNDGIDNDSDANIDFGCSGVPGVPPNYSWLLDTQEECEGAGGSWNTGDTQCTNIGWESPDGNDITNDERLVMKALGHPTGITMDTSRGDIWVSFNGMEAYSAGEQSISGEGLIKISASNTDDYSVYCQQNSSGIALPGRKPADIVYDSVNDRIWIAHDPSWVNYQPASGISKIDPETGRTEAEYTRQTGYVWGSGGPFVIDFDSSSDGGPYIWASNSEHGEHLVKFDIANATFTHDYYPLPGIVYDFTFDRRNPSNPYIWGAHADASLLSQNQINSPYTTVTYVPKGAASGDVLFDGTYVWTSNRSGYSVSKYRAVDGKKIGDYGTGRNPNFMVFDGTNIWTFNNYDLQSRDITKIRAIDGARLGDFNKGQREMGADAVFDGRYIWNSNSYSNSLRKIDTQNCTDPDGGGPAVGSCANKLFTASSGLPVNFQPNKIIYDGNYIWATSNKSNNGNQIIKISFSDNNTPNNINDDTIAVVGTYTFTDIGIATGNINLIEFDGTYIWLGTIGVDGFGNSVYKFDPNNCSGSACPLAGRFPIYHEAGKCSNTNLYCSKNGDCTGGGTCQMMGSRVSGMTFDGTNMWIYNGTSNDNIAARECSDDIDNDGDGLKDGADPNCRNSGNSIDLHEASLCDDNIDNDNDGLCDWDGCNGLPAEAECIVTGNTDNQNKMLDTEGAKDSNGNWIYSNQLGLTECRDGKDNDGNGLCDFDGAVGSPGCSGKPDPGCTNAEDRSEASRLHDSHLTRVVAATNQIVESVRVGNYSRASGMIFNGSSIWLGISNDSYVLHQYYSGSGLGATDLAGAVNLQGSLPGTAQPGSFSISGSAVLAGRLTVVGDLVVQNNEWGSAGVNKNFGTSCDDGEFATEVTSTGIVCKKL